MKRQHFTSDGSTIRVRLERDKGSCSSGVLAIVEVEDDGFWHEKMQFDSAWLPELLNGTREATKALKEFTTDWPKRAKVRK